MLKLYGRRVIEQMRRIRDTITPSQDLHRTRNIWSFESKPVALVDGFPARVAFLKGFGNAIVPQVAAQFIEACEEALNLA